MSLEDPFLIVQNEVFDALIKLRNNFTRWTELQENSNELSRDEYSSFVTELKNGLKSIQWDLDELEESLENSERMSKLDNVEMQKRKTFIAQTREEIKSMNEQLAKGSSKLKMADFSINFGPQQLQNGTKYHRLINAPEMSNPSDVSKPQFDNDDEQKSPYVPNHSIVFDETDHSANVIHLRDGKFDRIRQLLHLTTERRQWMAAGLMATLFILLIVALV